TVITFAAPSRKNAVSERASASTPTNPTRKDFVSERVSPPSSVTSATAEYRYVIGALPPESLSSATGVNVIWNDPSGESGAVPWPTTSRAARGRYQLHHHGNSGSRVTRQIAAPRATGRPK